MSYSLVVLGTASFLVGSGGITAFMVLSFGRMTRANCHVLHLASRRLVLARLLVVAFTALIGLILWSPSVRCSQFCGLGLVSGCPLGIVMGSWLLNHRS